MTIVTHNPYNWIWRWNLPEPIESTQSVPLPAYISFVRLLPKQPIYIQFIPAPFERPSKSEAAFYKALRNGTATTGNFNFYINFLTQTKHFDKILSLLQSPYIISLANCVTFNTIIKAAGNQKRFDIATIFYRQALCNRGEINAVTHTSFINTARKCGLLQVAIDLFKTIKLEIPEDCIEILSATDRPDVFEIAEFIYTQVNDKEYLRSSYVYMSYIHAITRCSQPFSKVIEAFETAKKLDMVDFRVNQAYQIAKQKNLSK